MVLEGLKDSHTEWIVVAEFDSAHSFRNPAQRVVYAESRLCRPSRLTCRGVRRSERISPRRSRATSPVGSPENSETSFFQQLDGETGSRQMVVQISD